MADDSMGGRLTAMSLKQLTGLECDAACPTVARIDNGGSVCEQTRWRIKFDPQGRLSMCGDELEQKDQLGNYRKRGGNYRVNFSDEIEYCIGFGTFDAAVSHLNVETPVGAKERIYGKVDRLGNWSAWWQPTPAGGAGPYRFGVELRSASASLKLEENTIVVEPNLLINGVSVSPSALSLQTVLSRCLGPVDQWVESLRDSSRLGYNMIHFTPIQRLGESGSSYSIADQNCIADHLVSEQLEPADRLKDVSRVVHQLEQELGLLSSIDIVLNHTASNSEFLRDHPDSGYHIGNSPHLLAALELDWAIKKFSDEIVDGVYSTKHPGLDGSFTTHQDLSLLLRVFEIECLQPFKIHEWFQLDLDACVAEYESGVEKHGHVERTVECSDDETRAAALAEVMTYLGVKRGISVPGDRLRHLFGSVDDLKRHLTHISAELKLMGDDTASCVLRSLEGHVRYERIECKRGVLGKAHWESLLPRYFTPVAHSSGKQVYLANNGWVMGWSAKNDFAAAGYDVYLKRELVVWSDCVKLRYGAKEEDSPFIWQWMRKYCSDMCKTFHAVRLDNCHSTPIHVAKAMLRECRKARKNMWVYAELFTGDEEVDCYFERELGLNALVREAMQAHSPADLSHNLSNYAQFPVAGCLSQIPSARRSVEQHILHLKLSLCPALLYDCTHDNETPFVKRTAADALSSAALLSAMPCAVGSTRGYDELVAFPLSVVSERRQYRHHIREDGSRNAFALGVTYDGVGCEVNVYGDWDNWRKPTKCVGGEKNVFEAEVMVGIDQSQYQYKFVVDGEWKHNPHQPYITDKFGNVNNVLKTDFCELPGMMRARCVLNQLHKSLGEEGFSEMHVEYKPDDLILIQRHNPDTKVCVYYIVRTAFSEDYRSSDVTTQELKIPGRIAETYFAGRLSVPSKSATKQYHDPNYITGIEGKLNTYGSMEQMVHITPFEKDHCMLRLHNFAPGSVIVFSTYGSDRSMKMITKALHGLPDVVRGMSLTTASYILFSCMNEELDRTEGARGCYDVPHHGELTYAGLVGIIGLLDSLRHNPRTCLSHPICENIRAGNWFMDYTINRLSHPSSCPKVCQWLKSLWYELHNARDSDLSDVLILDNGSVELDSVARNGAFEGYLEESHFSHGLSRPEAHFNGTTHCARVNAHCEGFSGTENGFLNGSTSEKGGSLANGANVRLPEKRQSGFFASATSKSCNVPFWVRPTVVDMMLSSLYYCIQCEVLNQLRFPQDMRTDSFLISLYMASLQFYSYTPSAPLVIHTEYPSISAGLPHFSTGYMRNWGRDTFIALKGMLLVTGRFSEARETIQAFGKVVRHGLVPNLLDGGSRPRYNARDATWFFLQAIQDYCLAAPEGTKFLGVTIELKFPPEKDSPPVHTIADLIYHILYLHAKGIAFREWDAGKTIDEHMADGGFDIAISMDPKTGFILGGNVLNCGTWMDKMGSSIKAGNKGMPATSRDGAAVEIIGLLKSTLRFVCSLPRSVFPYSHFCTGAGEEMSFKMWDKLLAENFESYFYIPTSSEDNPNIDATLVHRTEIYKDSFKATLSWMDYQLRPNFCIAMSVAPELFSRDNAIRSLESVEKNLWGSKQLGLKTLDPFDQQYRGDYDNGNDGEDKALAHGWNYHQGPEWVWPLGYFLEAKRQFPDPKSADDKQSLMAFLVNHREHLKICPWRSLPELTNADGRSCSFSCPAQAWSISTLLAFVHELLN